MKAPVQVQNPKEEDSEIIYEAPEGEQALMSRDCESFELGAYESVHSSVLGSISTFVTTEDGEVYIGNPISGQQVESFIKGVMLGDTLSIQGAQPIYEEFDWDTEEYYTVYAVPMEIVVDENQQSTCIPITDMRYDLVLNSDGQYESVDHNKMLAVCLESDALVTGYNYAWTGFGDLKFAEVTSKPVEIPEGAEIQYWAWRDQYETALTKVVRDGNDIYLSGMDRNIPDAWIKGTIEGDQATFPSGQYLGPDYLIGYLSYFCGAYFEYKSDPETYIDFTEGTTLISYTLNGYDVCMEGRSHTVYLYCEVDKTVVRHNKVLVK